jgi:excisionase family DNA binding protein
MTSTAPGRSNTSPTGLPALLAISQVAEETGLSTKTIRRRLADGTLRGVRIGPRAIRVERDSIIELLQPLG